MVGFEFRDGLQRFLAQKTLKLILESTIALLAAGYVWQYFASPCMPYQ